MDTNDQEQSRRRNDLPGKDDQTLQSLERYWQTLRDAEQIPARTDLQPSMIDHVLPYAFILQRVAPGTARFRVAGQKLHDLLKMDARGMPLTTLFHAEARDQVQDYVELAFAEPAIIALPLTSPGNVMRPALNGTMLLLPMRDHEGQATRLLGALVTDPHCANRPRRFGIPDGARIRHETLGYRPVMTQIMPRQQVPIKRPDVARPALRLVVNNR